MKTKKLLAVVFILVPIFIIAQSPDYTLLLQKFKTTEYSVKSLDLEGEFNQTTNYFTAEVETVDSLSESSKNNNYELNFSINPNFSLTHNSRKKIESANIYLEFSSGLRNLSNEYEKNTANNQKRKSEHFNLHLDGSYTTDLYYLQNDKNFLKLAGYLSYGTNYHYTNENDGTIYQKRFSPLSPIGFGATVGHGHGRLEYVDDMVEAIYILNELSENKQLAREPDDKTFKLFADQITLIKNERFFDHRLYRQKSMKVLTEKLMELGLIDKESISLYNTLMDYHFQANFQQRPSGQRLEYSISPNLNYSTQEEKNKEGQISSSQKELQTRIIAGISYDNSLPLSLKWQRNFNLSFMYRIEELKENFFNGTDSEEFTSDEDYMQINGQFSLGYYPNTRTSINSGIQAILVNTKSEITGWNGMGSLFSTINYYFSERLRLNVNLTLYYLGSKMNYQEESITPYWVIHNSFNTSINSSLIYSIF